MEGNGRIGSRAQRRRISGAGPFAQVMPDRVADKVYHALYVEFLEDVHAVGADGLNAEMQFFRDLSRA